MHSTPQLVGPLRNTDTVRYDGEKMFEGVFSRFDTMQGCDRQTDRQTDGRTSVTTA